MHKWTRYWDERPVNRPSWKQGWTEEQGRAEAAERWGRMESHLLRLRRPTDVTMLDFGCGDGRFSRFLADAGLKIHAVDVAPKRVAVAKSECALRGHDVVVHLVERGQLPFPDASLDGLFTNVVLLHIPDDEFDATAAELRRVLKPGALVLMCENTTAYHARTSSIGHVVFRSGLDAKNHDYRTVQYTDAVKAGEKTDLVYEILEHQGRNKKQDNVTIEKAAVER